MTIPGTGFGFSAGGHIVAVLLRSPSGSHQEFEHEEAVAVTPSTSTPSGSAEYICSHGKKAGSLERRSNQFSRHNLPR
ncbi:hypothetical protein NM688_g6837 [Phlebia brevispora]|uniref:Uncharacterized protein n=1 Tax=Phlebia brevispora TaxID=194682 RepID=A0ACC1SC11_9APHY|nr:hypothetical protein NM688_g6837 [Phlebia brevispora]